MTRGRLLAPAVLLIAAMALAPRAATLTAAQWPSAAKPAAPEYGPPNGTLVIGGGSSVGLPIEIIRKFIELGGGVDGTFVIVPTGGGNFDGTGDNKTVHVYVESQVISPWLNLGLKNVKMLHTHDPKIADTMEFAKVLSDATAVWFNGGRHHHIVDSYAGTLTYTEFHKVLERGGVIGGSSGGATIQGDYLVRGDSRTNTIVMTDEPNHQKGFEFLRRSAIDQHIDARNRWDDLIPVIKRYPNLLGIGLSEDTAIVVKGDQFEVMGTSKVAIHDNTRKYQLWEKPYYLLGAGDTYNMKTRRVVRGTARPRSPSGGVVQESRSAAPSGTAVGPGHGSGSVPAPVPIRLLRLLERLLMIAGDHESWWQIEAIDVDSDGEIDLLRIHLVNINGDTMVWEIERQDIGAMTANVYHFAQELFRE
jgi:cyanophycinase